jgi:ribonuclease T2
MNKFFIILLFFTAILSARYESYPIEACPAFDNLKHTKNTGEVHLDTSRRYTILERHHKNQTLVLIRGENPPQRWVDDRCFSDEDQKNGHTEEGISDPKEAVNTKEYKQKESRTAVSKDNILALSWHHAFCQTHRYKKECKRDLGSLFRFRQKEHYFVLHGLWPQPKSKMYCGVPSHWVKLDREKRWDRLPDPDLSDEVQEALQEAMPGYVSGLHKHEWIKHGTCYGTDADTYFETAITLLDQLNRSEVKSFFVQNAGKVISIKEVRAQFDRAFGLGAGRHVQMECKGGLITELWLHIGEQSDDLAIGLKKGKRAHSRCSQGRIDRAGF